MADAKEKTIALVSTVTGWDSTGAAGTETALFTVPTGKTFIPMFVVMRTCSKSLATAQVTFGATGGTCDEFRGDVTLTPLDGTTKSAIIASQDSTRNTPDGGVIMAAAAVFGIEVTVADADGGTATIDTFGFLY